MNRRRFFRLGLFTGLGALLPKWITRNRAEVGKTVSYRYVYLANVLDMSNFKYRVIPADNTGITTTTKYSCGHALIHGGSVSDPAGILNKRQITIYRDDKCEECSNVDKQVNRVTGNGSLISGITNIWLG